MTGRWTGGVLLLAAITAVIAGHGLLRADLAGSPLATTVPGPPRPGDCARSAPDPLFKVTDERAVVDPIVLGPCSGFVAGEFVSVTAGHPRGFDTSIGAVMGTSGDCWTAASAYAGFATAGGVARLPAGPVGTVDWRPELQVRGQRVGASPLQKSAGRDWSACLVRPENLADYVGSVHGALGSGVAPAEYGNCSPSSDPSVYSMVPCSHPHPTERLGWSTVPAGSLTRAQLDESCRSLAGRLLRTADPTYSGVLSIVAATGALTTCLAIVDGPARLTGSLVGIGAGPLPLTT